jgi:hypothetical protein
MTDNSTRATDSTDSKGLRRRSVLAAASSTLTLTAAAGCLASDEHNGSASTGGGKESLPDRFASIDVGKYTMTVDVRNSNDLESVALRRPTSGVIERKQASATVEFVLMDSTPYSPGEFVIEARQDDSVVSEHELALQPKPRITAVELLAEQDRDRLTSSQDEENECARHPTENVFTIKNHGSGPAALEQLVAPFPDGVDADRSPKLFYCHRPPSSVDHDLYPVIAPGETLNFSPTFGSKSVGYRSQEPGATYDAVLKIKEAVTGDLFEQSAEMRFVDRGDGNRMPTYDIPIEDAD